MKVLINRNDGKFSVLFDDLSKEELLALRDSLDEEGHLLTDYNLQKDDLDAAFRAAFSSLKLK